MRKDTKLRKSNIINSEGLFLRQYKENGRPVLTLEGVYHHNMMTRATNENYKIKFPTYKDVKISDNFRDFQYFAKWCQSQKGFGNLGWVLDKDILNRQNKIYSESNCVFVPPLINAYFTERSEVRNLPRGVTWCESENCYKAYCSALNGKNKTLGRFKTPEDASRSYNTFKQSLAQKLIEMYKESVDVRVVVKLENIYKQQEEK